MLVPAVPAGQGEISGRGPVHGGGRWLEALFVATMPPRVPKPPRDPEWSQRTARGGWATSTMEGGVGDRAQHPNPAALPH